MPPILMRHFFLSLLINSYQGSCMENPMAEEIENQPKRPPGLRIACIFSWVYNGILLVITIVSAFYGSYIFNLFSRILHSQTLTPLSSGLILTGIGFLFLITMVSVMLIWKLNIRGFYLYIIIKVVLIIILFTTNYLNYFNLGYTIFMFLVFWSYRKRLQKTLVL